MSGETDTYGSADDEASDSDFAITTNDAPLPRPRPLLNLGSKQSKGALTFEPASKPSLKARPAAGIIESMDQSNILQKRTEYANNNMQLLPPQAGAATLNAGATSYRQ